MGGRGGRGGSGGSGGNGGLGERYESIFESGRKRVSYKEAMQEYGKEFTVKGTYQDGTIEVNPSPVVAKVMQIMPKEYLADYRQAFNSHGTKAQAAAELVNGANDMIRQGVKPDKDAPKWVQDVYRYTQARNAMSNMFGYDYSRQGISKYHEHLQNTGTERAKQSTGEAEKKLRKKLKGFGF